MVFEFSSHSLDKISADVVLVFAFAGKDSYLPSKNIDFLDKSLKSALTNVLKTEKFKGKEGSSVTFHTHAKVLSPKIIVVGLGKKEEFTANTLRKVTARVAKSLTKKIDSLVLNFSDESPLDFATQANRVAEGLLLGTYSFGRYKKQEKDVQEFASVIISEPNTKNQKIIHDAVKMAESYTQATRLARDLVNEQAAVATPTYLAKLAQDLAHKDKNIKVTIFDKLQCEKMGMEAFLGIARAADTPPKFIVLEYMPARSSTKRKLAIIGKGITFDSGGINVKPESAMSTMKCDMSGAAAVLGMFSVISSLKPDFSVMGVIAATPNLISGTSLVPGDIVRAMNGKTIEILNTDAEGRVTMADSLSYAVKHGATELVDLATLTGACMAALGPDIAGLMTNNQDLAKKVKTAAFDAGEEVWELPLPKEYKDFNKSDVADIANLSHVRWGGALTAGLFLQEFIANKPWVHLDIAGPAFAEREFALGPKGGTGYGVRLLLNLLKQQI